MKIGIFGGTFDPPHIGHLILTMELSHQLALDRVYWVLTPAPPHKPDQAITPVDLREEMLRSILDGEPTFDLSRVDIDRPPPHYAVDTVHIFRRQFPGDELVYLMGEDSLRDLPDWERPGEFLAAIDHLGVFSRREVEPEVAPLTAALEGLPGKLHLSHGPLIQISSSEIRARVKGGRPYRYFLPPAVYSIVEENHLYRRS